MAGTHSIRYSSQTDVGVKRSHNQDACAAQPAADEKHHRSVGHVFVVADGMGGHAVGEKASAKAVRDIPLTYQKHVRSDGAEAAIRRAFVEANAGIFQIGTNNPEFKGLGTTSTALFLRPEGAWIGHVGDSRAYRIRDGVIEQLTFDHSWVWEIAKRQGVDPDELGDFKRNVIIRSLGPEAEVEVDIEGPHPIEPGDQFLLCSDGLTNHVKPDEIGAVAAVFPPADACQVLVELANLRGGSDNITCLIAQIPEGDDVARTRSTTGKPMLTRVRHWLERRYAWPVTLLAVGCGLVGLAIWMRLEQVPGVVPTFALATLITLIGLGGFAHHLRRKPVSRAGEGVDLNRELRVYKSHSYTLDRKLYDRMTDQEAQARKAAEEGQIAIEPEAYAHLTAMIEASTRAGDWAAAFRARCLTLRQLARTFQQHRKEEEFKPNWTTQHKPVGN